ncbi:MAG: zf-HC2 domain-containing protein [Planctomycetes bacterium]|nr:zf-HC2 domain-containing protein [Planctomycetota bacterium]
MLRCTECQPLILDHLFGLLEAPEIKAVAAHLSTCPACAAERTEAAKVHGLIAQAAKIAFPAVRFEAPDARPVAKPAPLVAKTNTQARNPVLAPLPSFEAKPPMSPAPAKTQRQDRRSSKKSPAATGSRIARIIPWVVAAAVLIAIPGTVVPVLNLLNRAEVARKDAASTRRLAGDVGCRREERCPEPRHSQADLGSDEARCGSARCSQRVLAGRSRSREHPNRSHCRRVPRPDRRRDLLEADQPGGNGKRSPDPLASLRVDETQARVGVVPRRVAD